MEINGWSLVGRLVFLFNTFINKPFVTITNKLWTSDEKKVINFFLYKAIVRVSMHAKIEL